MIQCSCGAQNSPQSRLCWLCQRDLSTIPRDATSVVWQATAVPPPVPFADDLANDDSVAKQFALSSLVLFGVLLVFLVVIACIAPGLGILAAICLLPALLNSRVYMLRKQLSRQDVSPLERVMIFLASVTTVVGIAGVSLVVAFSTFFVLCLGELALNQNNLEWSQFGAIAAFGLTSAVGLVIAVFAWHFNTKKP